MTIVDTIADEHYRDRPTLAHAFAAALNEEARELAALGVDVIQFDEPAFNVYMREVRDWGVAALERAAEGPQVHDRRPHLLRLRHQGQHRLEGDARRALAPVRRDLPGARRRAGSTRSRSNAATRKVPIELIGLLKGKDVLVGCIDVASDVVETPEDVAATIRAALPYVPAERLYPCTNCGMAPMAAEIAYAKLAALAAGAELARKAM